MSAARSVLESYAQTDPRGGKLFAGRYLLVRELGRGGMGAVYSAFDTSSMRRVALKRIEARRGQNVEMLEQRFRREVRALAASKHSGTPMLLHDDRSADGVAYFTMEIVAGEPLRGLLARERLGTVRALTLAIDLGQILASMHAAGVVHRDVKPGNVLIEAADRVRLVDFGACAFLPHFFMREDIEADRLTATVNRWATGDFDAVHTPGYSAPEIGRDEDGEASVRNDIYSLCAVAYEMIAGRPLFDKEALRARTIVPEEFAPELAPLAALLASGTSFEAFDRPRSMAELIQGLEIARTRVLRAGAVAPRRRSAVATLALATTAASALFAAWTGGSGGPPDSAVTPAADPVAAPMIAVDGEWCSPARESDVPEETTAGADADVLASSEADASEPSPPSPTDPEPDRQLRRVLAGHSAAVQRCVDTEGGILARLAVAVTLEGGKVDRVRLVGRKAPMLASCVQDALRGVRVPGEGPTQMFHTFLLRPLRRP